MRLLSPEVKTLHCLSAITSSSQHICPRSVKIYGLDCNKTISIILQKNLPLNNWVNFFELLISTVTYQTQVSPQAVQLTPDPHCNVGHSLSVNFFTAFDPLNNAPSVYYHG